jgi:hypothetical protein
VWEDVFGRVGQSLPIGLKGWNYFLYFRKWLKQKEVIVSLI